MSRYKDYSFISGAWPGVNGGFRDWLKIVRKFGGAGKVFHLGSTVQWAYVAIEHFGS